MNNVVIFGATQSGKTTLLGYLATAMLRNPQFNEEVLQNFKLIRSLTTTDEFSIGNPYNPVNVNKDVILPSFVSMDKDELRKFKNEKSEGSSKRIHRKIFTICTSERNVNEDTQNENETISCTFVDMPGFRQRLSDKYLGFFEGNIGIAVLKLQEIVRLNDLLTIPSDELSANDKSEVDILQRRLFEPIRIWCDYRSPSSLIIAISQIDRNLTNHLNKEDSIKHQIEDICKSIKCIRDYTSQFSRGVHIPISPISVKISSEPNYKRHPRMSVFFRRNEENIYSLPNGKTLPGDGTFIACLKRVMPFSEVAHIRDFSMANVYRPRKAIINSVEKTALNIYALHGTIRDSDTLMLGPVIDKRDKEVIFTQCDISSIKADGVKEPSKLLLEGNVGGLIFKSIKVPGTRFHYNINSNPKESDISILKSTILFAGDIQKGDIIELELLKSDHTTLDNGLDEIYSRIIPSVMPFDEVTLFWYGKKLIVNVIGIDFLQDKLKLNIIVSKNERNSIHFFVLPCDEDGQIKHKDNILLAIPKSYYSCKPKAVVQNIFTYVSFSIARIRNSADIGSIEVKPNNDLELEPILGDIIASIQYDSKEHSFIVPLNQTRQPHDIYSKLSIIKRNIKEWFSRLTYRQSGGVKITLLDNRINKKSP